MKEVEYEEFCVIHDMTGIMTLDLVNVIQETTRSILMSYPETDPDEIVYYISEADRDLMVRFPRFVREEISPR